MTRAVKTFTAYVEDQLGWDYPQALVAIRRVTETSQKTFESEDCKGNYVEDINSHIIKYSANFWGTKQQQMAGKPSRPILSKVEGEEESTDIFEVDVEHAQSVQVLNSNAPSNDKIFTLIELDLIRRFK